MLSRVNWLQLKQIIAKRFGIAVEAIAKIEKWYKVYFVVIKGRKALFISQKGFFCVPSGYSITKRTNANIVSDSVFQVRYMAENTIVGSIEYTGKFFVTGSRKFNDIEGAIAYLVDCHTKVLKYSIMGY